MDELDLIEPPDAEGVVTLAEAKDFLRITGDDTAALDDDALVRRLIATAVAYLDGPDGFLGRSLAPRRYRMTLDTFPRDGIELPAPPLRTVDLIRYVRADGVTVDLPASEYRVAIPGAAPGVIRPRGLWPPTAMDGAAVQIEFTAGYETVPQPIRTAILQHVALLYENRETAAYGSASFQTVPFAGLDLVQPYRRWTFG